MSELIPLVTEHLTNNREITTKNSLFFTPTTPEKVTTVIRSFEAKKSVKENDISIKFLKHSTLILSPYISNLFNRCVEQGEFPNALKIAEVVPMYKKGNPNLCTNYRPISLLSPFSKIL